MTSDLSPVVHRSHQPQAWPWVRRAGLAFTAIALNFVPAGADFFSYRNRYLFHWERADAAWLIAAVSCLTGLCLAAWWLTERLASSIGHWLLRFLFLMSLFGGLLACTVPSLRSQTGLAALTWAILSLAAGVASLSQFAAYWKKTLAAAWLLLPLPLVVIVWLVSFEGIHTDHGTIDNLSPASSEAGVLIVILDEWSASRTFRNGRVRPDLPALHRFARYSTSYVNARTPSTNTVQSMPRFLFQTESKLTFTKAGLGWALQNEPSPWPADEGLVELANRHGYSVSVVGFLHPYATLLKTQEVDYVRSFCYYPKEFVASRIGGWLLRASGYLTDPLSLRLSQRLTRRQESRFAYETHLDHLAAAKEVLARFNEGVFVVLHLDVPHFPYVFSTEGDYRPGGEMEKWDDVTGYETNLKYADRVFGELVSMLNQRGMLDLSTVVVTSDHSWRRDPSHPSIDSPEQWSPLLVKTPGQTEGRVVERRVTTQRLEELLFLARDGLGPWESPDHSQSGEADFR